MEPAEADSQFIAQLRASCEGMAAPDILRGLYWDGSALAEPWFEALAAALAGYDHVRCVHMLAEHKPGPLLSVVSLLALLSRQAAQAEWAHYHIAHELVVLFRGGVREARLPMAMHSLLALELFAGNDYVQSLPHSLLANGLARWMPREAVRHGLLSLKKGNTLGLQDLHEAVSRLGLMPADGNLDMIAAQQIGIAIGNPLDAPVAAIHVRESKAVQSFPIALSPTVVHPRPEGAGHYYQFKRAGTPIPVEPVQIHRVNGATLSCDLTRLGRTEIYCYGQGTCLSDLCLGTQPFIAEGDECLQVGKTLLMVDDIFSGKPNVSHFLLDQMPRLLAYRRLDPGPATLLQCDTSPYYTGALEALGVEDVLTPPTRRFSIRAPALLMTSNIVQRYDHPVHTGSARTAALLRDAFGVSSVRSKGRRLYISRADATSRRAVNNAEVEAVFQRHGFETIILSGLSFAQQRTLFGEASHVASVHGAGLTNVLFAPGDCRVFEILPPLVASHTYWMLCSAIGQHYRTFLADDTELPTPDYENWTHDPSYNDRDVRIDPGQLDAALAAFV